MGVDSIKGDFGEFVEDVEGLLRLYENGVNVGDYMGVNDDFMYFYGVDRIGNLILIKVDIDYYATKHYFKKIEDDEWKELYTD